MKSHKTILVRNGEVILCSTGFVLVKLKEDHEIELRDAKEMISACEEICGNGEFVTMLDGGVSIDIGEDAMLYCAKYKKDEWKAFAIIVRTISERIFANYYLKFKKPIRPTKIFSSPDKGIEWLQGFVRFENPEKGLMYKGPGG